MMVVNQNFKNEALFAENWDAPDVETTPPKRFTPKNNRGSFSTEIFQRPPLKRLIYPAAPLLRTSLQFYHRIPGVFMPAGNRSETIRDPGGCLG